MAIAIPSCPVCGYPIAASPGDSPVCANCGANLIADDEGVTVPTWLIVGTVALALGVILGPAILSTTESGSQYLARAAKKKFST
jgi:hypothetical protein